MIYFGDTLVEIRISLINSFCYQFGPDCCTITHSDDS
jgi:hypothetical protein